MDNQVLIAPFSREQIAQINWWQANATGGPDTEPICCPSAAEESHGTVGGHRGILIAIHNGLVCPYCSYRTDQVPAVLGEQHPVTIVDFDDAESVRQLGLRKQTVEGTLRAYRTLQAQHRPGAAVMVDCLEQRIRHWYPSFLPALEGPWWPVYWRPILDGGERLCALIVAISDAGEVCIRPGIRKAALIAMYPTLHERIQQRIDRVSVVIQSYGNDHKTLDGCMLADDGFVIGQPRRSRANNVRQIAAHGLHLEASLCDQALADPKQA